MGRIAGLTPSHDVDALEVETGVVAAIQGVLASTGGARRAHTIGAEHVDGPSCGGGAFVPTTSTGVAP